MNGARPEVDSIKIVLRHERRAEYYGGLNLWVSNPEQAIPFENAIRALHYSVLNRLPAEVVPIIRPFGTKASAAILSTDTPRLRGGLTRQVVE